MDGKLVRELHEKAQLAGKYIGAHRLGGGWDGYNDDEALWHKIIGAGEIEFHRNAGAACIVFKDIRPKKVLHSKYEKPMLSNTVIEDINASVIVNQSSEEVERTYTYSEEETNSSLSVRRSSSVVLNSSINLVTGPNRLSRFIF